MLWALNYLALYHSALQDYFFSFLGWAANSFYFHWKGIYLIFSKMWNYVCLIWLNYFPMHQHMWRFVSKSQKQSLWGQHGPCRPQMGPMLAPWTLLSGMLCFASCRLVPTKEDRGSMSFNSSVLSAASVNWAALVQIKAYRLLGAKPLPEPVLTNYHLDS